MSEWSCLVASGGAPRAGQPCWAFVWDTPAQPCTPPRGSWAWRTRSSNIKHRRECERRTCKVGALKGEPLAQETASKTDVTTLSWPHHAASAPWSSIPALQR